MFNLAIERPETVGYGDPMGICRHFVLFPSETPNQKLHNDGYYELKTEFMVEKDMSKMMRMWKGGSLKFKRNELKIGDNVKLALHLEKITERQTSRGLGIFTTEVRNIENEFGIAIEEKRQLVYLQEKFKFQPKIVRKETVPDFSITTIPTSIALFRFSAATFNAHRIHYSEEYANFEGYPAPLVHGPLTLSLLLDTLALNSRGRFIAQFDYNCVGPAFVNNPLKLNGKFMGDRCLLWASDHLDSVVLKGTALFE